MQVLTSIPLVDNFFTVAPAASPDAFIDLYCERTGPGLWNEPLNALSNISFFIGAWFAWRLRRARTISDTPTLLLIMLMVAIGIGSTLFHTFASRWAEWLDVLPILVFQLFFIWHYAQRMMGLSPLMAVSLPALLLLLGRLSGRDPQLYNGSTAYLPALLFFVAFAIFHFRVARSERWLLAAAAAVFVVALLLRTVDIALCSSFPLGTHLFWHLLNGIVLYLCIRAIMPAPAGTG